MMRWWYMLRCLFCEMLIAAALKVAPKDYVPSFVELIIEARKARPAMYPHPERHQK